MHPGTEESVVIPYDGSKISETDRKLISTHHKNNAHFRSARRFLRRAKKSPDFNRRTPLSRLRVIAEEWGSAVASEDLLRAALATGYRAKKEGSHWLLNIDEESLAELKNEALGLREDRWSPKVDIIVREVSSQLPRRPALDTFDALARGDRFYYSENLRWFYVELHVAYHGTYGPTALATVSVDGERAHMASMFVVDHMRGEGYGTRLVEEVGKRWPQATWESTIASEPFHRSLVRRGMASRRDNGFTGFYRFKERAD